MCELVRGDSCWAATSFDSADENIHADVDVSWRIGAKQALPLVIRCDVIAVIGPKQAGVKALVATLRQQRDNYGIECDIVEAADLAVGQAPKVMLFVVSACASITESECALLHSAAHATDGVLAVVSKIDIHRTWRAVLDTNRAVLARYAPRYATTQWLGVAAAPELGCSNMAQQSIDELGYAVVSLLRNDALDRRNRLRANETHLLALRRQLYRNPGCDDDDSSWRQHLIRLGKQRDAVLRHTGMIRTHRTNAVRHQMHQVRAQLLYRVRSRCITTRGELRDTAAQTGLRELNGFSHTVQCRVNDIMGEIEHATTQCIAAMASELALPWSEMAALPALSMDVAAPSIHSRRLETQMMAVLGMGFGVGAATWVSLIMGRLLGGIHAGSPVLSVLAGAGAGAVLAMWVVRARYLLRNQALCDRWITEVIDQLRVQLEQWVTAQLLAAQTTLMSVCAHRSGVEAAQRDHDLARIDADIAWYSRIREQRVAAHAHRFAIISRVLARVYSELG